MKDIKNMTLKEKLGQLLFVGFDGYEYNDHIKTLIEDYKVGNIILFARNVKDLKQLSALNRKLHEEIYKHTGIIPLISIDQEGGIVTRIMNGATFCPGNMTLAATEEENCYIIGQIMGKELSRLGINMNLAPSLDVNNNPKNPVIGVRSYSDDPKLVSKLGTLFIKGLQEQGIIATAKHFPGHGDTNVDSHLGLPIVNHDKKRLDEVELYPFKVAIKEGVNAIMSAHIVFKAYEKEEIPATISKNVMSLLRKDLGFKGLIVSDCMEMKAIDNFYTTAKGVALGIEAGLDMAFVSHTLSKQIAALEEIEKAINEGKIIISEIDEKVARILEYKEKTLKALQVNFFNNQDNLSYFENKKHQEIAQGIVDKSLTLVKGDVFKLQGKTLLLATVPFATTIVEDELDSRNILEAVKREIPQIDCLEMPMKEYNEELVAKVKDYDQVVICTYNAMNFPKQAEMVNALIDASKNSFILSTRNPYDLHVLKNVKNYACLYEYTPNAVKTVVKYLKGEITPQGKLPIKL